MEAYVEGSVTAILVALDGNVVLCCGGCIMTGCGCGGCACRSGGASPGGGKDGNRFAAVILWLLLLLWLI